MAGKRQKEKHVKPKKGVLPEQPSAKIDATQTISVVSTENQRAQRVCDPPGGFVSSGPAIHASPVQRSLIFHYHLFKNAGTSVDELLRRNFGAQWAAREFHINRRDNASAVTEFIRNNRHLRAISSHTALLPVPSIEGILIFPIIFIRHPIDRLRSAYEFERKQNANTRGARLAKTHNFRGYLETLLQPPRSHQARNFQTYHLSMGSPGHGNYRARAQLAIDTLPFVGLVEAFEESVQRMTKLLNNYFPSFIPSTAHANAQPLATRPSLAERLTAIRSSIGDTFYDELTRSNADDLYIHEYVSAIYDRTSLSNRQSPAS